PRAGRDELIVECNWKTFVDNILECYHCPTVHPILAKTHDVQHVKYEYHGRAGAQVIEARPDLKDQAGPDTHDHYAAFVFPGLWLSGRAGESFFLLITDPIDVRHTRVTKEYFLPPGMPEDELSSRIATFRRVIGEDMNVCVSTQRGHDTGLVPPGYLAQNIEITVRHFQGLVMDMLRTERNEMPAASLGRTVKN
ncbi:MAG: RHO alpha subunit C-terminal catalytic domain-containing protein, partial [Vulcanimicrobiaceae bacterium]